MTIERRRPLPVGRYWVDVFEPNRVKWEAWRNSFVSAGKAAIDHTESFPEVDGAPAHDFIIFRVLTPTVWPDADMGFGVNVAPDEIQSSDDTVSKPDVPSGTEQLEAFGRDLSKAIGSVLAVVAGAVVTIALVSAWPRKGR